MSAIADNLGLASTILALGATALAVTRYTTRVYRRTLGSRRALQHKLWNIGPGVTLRHIEMLLGPPVYTRKASPDAQPPSPFDQSAESIFFTRHATIQVIHDTATGETLGFGVTVTDPDFHPTLLQVPRYPPWPRELRIGKSRFSTVDRTYASGIELWRGPYDARYSELHKIARAGRFSYLTFVLAHTGDGVSGSGASWGEFSLADIYYRDSYSGEFVEQKHTELDRFRNSVVINTVCVYGWDVFIDPAKGPFWNPGAGPSTPRLGADAAGPLRRLRNAFSRLTRRKP